MYKKSGNISFVVLIFSFLLLSSCSKDNPVSSQKVEKPSIIGIPSYTYDQVMAKYDNKDVLGVLTLQKEDVNRIVNVDGVLTNYDGIDDIADGTFYYNNEYNSIGTMLVNAVQLNEWHKGYYYNEKPYPINLKFGNGFNEIITDSPSPVPTFRDSVTFSNPVQITNYTRGQNVSRFKDFPLSWTGTNKDFVQIVLISNNYVTADSSDKSMGFGGYFENNGNVTFPAINLRNLKKGPADLFVRRFEPKFITLSNGKKVCVIGLSTKVVTLNITD